MTPTLIGLNGKARSGKDTSADFIEKWCSDYSATVKREAFARRLKESAAHALGVFKDEVDFCNKLKGEYQRTKIQVRMATPGTGPNAVVAELTGREFLQYYGTEAHRDVFDKNFWVNAVLPVTEGAMGHIFREDKYGDGSTAASMEPIPDWWESFLTTDEPDLIMDEIPHLVADYCVITDVRFDNEAQRIKDLGGQVWKVIREGSGAGDHVSEQELEGELIDLVIDNNGTLDDLEETVFAAMDEISGVTAAEEAIASELADELSKEAING